MAGYDNYVAGDRNSICDVCGFQYKASQLKKRWDGFMVCSADFEQRHPQDMVKPIRSNNRIKDARPEHEPVFVAVGEITANDL